MDSFSLRSMVLPPSSARMAGMADHAVGLAVISEHAVRVLVALLPSSTPSGLANTDWRAGRAGVIDRPRWSLMWMVGLDNRQSFWSRCFE